MTSVWTGLPCASLQEEKEAKEVEKEKAKEVGEVLASIDDAALGRVRSHGARTVSVQTFEDPPLLQGRARIFLEFHSPACESPCSLRV